VFLSHMGEMNLNVAAGKPRLIEKPFPWADAGNPAVAVGCFRPGRAVLVNLAPGRGEAYTLVIAPVEVQPVSGPDRMADTVHGWIKPGLPVADFLAEYSRCGGTHHSAMAYGASVAELAGFAEHMGMRPVVIE